MNVLSGIVYLYKIFFYQPLFNALILLYIYFPVRDFGIAVILLTVLIRFLLYPLMAESIRVQKVTSDLQPKINEIKEKYKNDREKQALMQLELLKSNNINLFNSFFVTFIQFPILIALYQAFSNGLKDGVASQLYSFVGPVGDINPMFLGLIDLSKASPVLALLAGLFQYYQSKMFYAQSAQKEKKGLAGSKNDPSQMMKKQMLYFLPVMTAVIFWSLPAALSLYVVASGVFSIIQQKIIFQKMARPEAEKKSPAPQT